MLVFSLIILGLQLFRIISKVLTDPYAIDSAAHLLGFIIWWVLYLISYTYIVSHFVNISIK